MAKKSDKITIKKYANRRLYDTESSTYITLDKLAVMIRQGRDFEVVDAKTGADITHQVLAQIIVDEESGGSTMLPVNFLRQLIGLYGNSMQGMVPQYLEAALEAFQRNQTVMREAFGGTMFGDLAKRNLAVLEGTARAMGVPTATSTASAASAAGAERAPAAAADDQAQSDAATEIEKLRAELAALQAKVERLGR